MSLWRRLRRPTAPEAPRIVKRLTPEDFGPRPVEPDTLAEQRQRPKPLGTGDRVRHSKTRDRRGNKVYEEATVLVENGGFCRVQFDGRKSSVVLPTHSVELIPSDGPRAA